MIFIGIGLIGMAHRIRRRFCKSRQLTGTSININSTKIATTTINSINVIKPRLPPVFSWISSLHFPACSRMELSLIISSGFR